MTKSEALKLVTILSAAYPNHPVSAETLEVYAGMLADLDYRFAETAVQALIQTSKWFPTIAEIREQVRRETDPFGWHARFGGDIELTPRERAALTGGGAS